MTVAVYLPIFACAVLAVGSGPLATRLAPRGGAWALTAAAVCTALSGLWALWLLVASLVDDLPWLGGVPRMSLPVNDALSAGAAVVLGWCLVRIAAELRRQVRLRSDVRGLLALPGGELVVLPDRHARAFAVPGRPGRIVVTDTMLRALSVAERRVLLAHERAHLRAGHPMALALASVAVSANPLLRPVQEAVNFLCERDADEQAGAEVGDRTLVAAALTTAALATASSSIGTSSGGSGGSGSSGSGSDDSGESVRGLATHALPDFHRHGVLDRVAAMRAPCRVGRRIGLVPVILVGAAAVAASIDATGDFTALLVRFLRG
jgi:hypothetical protein